MSDVRCRAMLPDSTVHVDVMSVFSRNDALFRKGGQFYKEGFVLFDPTMHWMTKSNLVIVNCWTELPSVQCLGFSHMIWGQRGPWTPLALHSAWFEPQLGRFSLWLWARAPHLHSYWESGKKSIVSVSNQVEKKMKGWLVTQCQLVETAVTILTSA